MTALEIDSVSLTRPLEMGRTLEIGLKTGLRNETLGFNGRITSEKNFITGSVNGPPDHGSQTCYTEHQNHMEEVLKPSTPKSSAQSF